MTGNRETLRLQRKLDDARADHRLSKWQMAGIGVLWALVLTFLAGVSIAGFAGALSGDGVGVCWLLGLVVGAGLSALTFVVYELWDDTRLDLRRARYEHEDATLADAGYL